MQRRPQVIYQLVPLNSQNLVIFIFQNLEAFSGDTQLVPLISLNLAKLQNLETFPALVSVGKSNSTSFS